MLKYMFLLIFPILGTIVGAYKVKNDTAAMEYLERFGYIEHDDLPPEGLTKEGREPVVLAFQKMCGINQTGELDKGTLKMMNIPRCGNKDMMRVPLEREEGQEDQGYHVTDKDGNRVQRYVFNQHGLKWKKREVTYRMGLVSEKMKKHVTKSDVLDAIVKAMTMWSAVCNLDLIHTPFASTGKADIELSFTSRFHPEDGFPFDGPGSVLAHAFPPGNSKISGDVHFEDEEDWRINSPKGTDVLFVAVHEVGHSLGLSHSATKGAIMAAYYGGYRPKLKLHQDDIDGVQALYGKREVPIKFRPKDLPPPRPVLPPTTTTTSTTMATTTRTTTRPTPRPTIRTTQRWIPLLTTTTTRRTTPYPITPRPTHRTTYATFMPEEDSDSSEIPRIRPIRPDLCIDPKIDAITTLNDNQIYVFKGPYVSQVGAKGQGVSPGWPNRIGYIFPGLEPDIDAAMTRDNGKTYFFKGNKYWRFTGTKIDPGFPKSITQHFRGIPSHVDSAFVWFGQFYFTKGDKFWRFNPKQKPHVDDRIYPLSTIDTWGLLGNGRVDAAFTAPNGELYLFSSTIYYRLDPTKFKIAEVVPPYPRTSRLYWFACSSFRPDSRNVRDDNAVYYEESYSPDDFE